MFILYLALFCISSYTVSGGRTVQAVIGRNVSFSFTIANITRDAIDILHNKSRLLWAWPKTNKIVVAPEKREKVQFSADFCAGETIKLTINLLNVTKKDAGIYTVADQWNSKEFNDSVLLQTNEGTMIPRIGIVRHIISEPSLMLQCFLSNSFVEKFFWKLNGSLLQNHGRYYHNNDSLSIRNLTADEQYNSYTCKEDESELESDPYRIQFSDPSIINCAPNITMVIEHDSLNVSCKSDCNPICTWQWTKTNPLSGQADVISVENELQLNNITRHDAGKISCTVQNVITGTVYTRFLSLGVAYGPDQLLLNTSNNIIEMDEFESTTISCFADCFPPCQIHWSKSDTEIHSTYLRVENIEKSGNFTCHARNEKNDNVTISTTIGIEVKSGAGYYAITTNPQEEDTETFGFPSNRLLIYLLIGISAMVAIGILICYLPKFVKCSRVHKAPHNIPFQVSGADNTHEEIPADSYWTIVSNAKGELSTALETNTKQSTEPTPTCSRTVADVNQMDESSHFHRIEACMELDGYIHPIHSSPLSTGVASARQPTDV